MVVEVASKLGDLACGAAMGMVTLKSILERDYAAAAVAGMWFVVALWVQEHRLKQLH